MESAKFCEKIVNSLCKMTEDCKRHFRLKTRYEIFMMIVDIGTSILMEVPLVVENAVLEGFRFT